MNILMISLAGDMRSDPVGDVLERHLEYARRLGGVIHVIGMAKGKDLGPSFIDKRLNLCPVKSSGHLDFALRAYRSVNRICAGWNIDLIYTQDPFITALLGLAARRRSGAPLIIGNHSSFIDNPLWINERRFLFPILNRLARWVLPRADAWRVVNPHEKSQYERRLGLPSDKIYCIPVPTNMAVFEHRHSEKDLLRIREKLGLKPENNVLLWVGRPVRVKRLPILFQAFSKVVREVPAARLLLIGDQRLQHENLDHMLRDMKLTDYVIWLREGIRHDDLSKYYQLADAFALPSRYEGFGNVLTEACASGLPIVSTDTAGARAIVQDGQTGYIVPVDDWNLFADKVVYLFRNPREGQGMGRKGRRHVKELFDYDKCVDGIVRMWRDVAGR